VVTTPVVALLRSWLSEPRNQGRELVFTTRSGGMLSRDALEHRLAGCVAKAINKCPLEGKRITLHVLRHYLPFLTMSSDIGQRSAEADKIESQRGRTERTTRHSLVPLKAVKEPEELIAGVITGRAGARVGLG